MTSSTGPTWTTSINCSAGDPPIGSTRSDCSKQFVIADADTGRHDEALTILFHKR